MRSLLTLAVIAAATAAVPALAQDPAAEGTTSFAGPRIEGLVGWDRLQNHGHDDGVAYGLGAGYDFQRGTTVFGLEGEVDDSNARRCTGAKTMVDPRICTSANRDLYVGGR